MRSWYFHGQYITNGLGANEMWYNTIFTSHELSSRRLSEEKQYAHIFTQVFKQRKWKNIKKRGCRVAFRTLPNIYNGAFLQKYNG